MKHKIAAIQEKSIAYELGILPGDVLLSIDGRAIIDVLDYRFALQSENLLVEIEKQDGEKWELDIEKEEFEDLGLVFELPLMSPVKLCKNKCIFCFVDQEPPGLRKTLYVKDDDWRLSFLHGNFITLTNLTDEEANRIAGLHLSPIRISVHAADLDIRKQMMGSRNAGNLFRHLRMFGKAGIAMHLQIVLCKGVNDGRILDDAIKKFERVPGAQSLAVVPVGLTEHRHGLFPLEPFTSDEANEIIRKVEAIQHQLKHRKNSAFVFLSDEWYIISGAALPSYNMYEGFPQLENGVGLVRLFEFDFLRELGKLSDSDAAKSVCIVTGTLAADFMRSLATSFCNKFVNVKITICKVANSFYGETVTVSGLLTGKDIISHFSRASCAHDIIFVPGNAFRANSEEMIDGATRSQLETSLGVSIIIGSQNGCDFARQLYGEIIC